MIHKPEIKILKNKEEIAFLFKDGIVTSNSIIKLIYSKKPGENYFHYTVANFYIKKILFLVKT